ncbi:hypothetical protein H4582DRAFT_2074070 [Lactarius indigo]|nr:hypothetical protein H4582DRAFT_2074070 [Lactarius indigo]
MSTTPSQSQRYRPVTRAKNTTQHPGQVVLDAQMKRRTNEEMAKVREQERLERRVAEQEIRAALKKVARIQDQQELEDIEADQPTVAPSLYVTEADKESDKYLSEEEAAPVIEDGEREEMGPGEGEGEDDGDIDDGKGEGGKSKSKSKKNPKDDSMRVLIKSYRKQPRLVARKSMIDVSLVNKVPPIPATKGKKPHARLAQSVAHPVEKSNSGICADWAAKVANANSSLALTATPTPSHGSTGGLGGFTHGSSTTPSTLPAYQKGLDDEIEVLDY